MQSSRCDVLSIVFPALLPLIYSLPLFITFLSSMVPINAYLDVLCSVHFCSVAGQQTAHFEFFFFFIHCSRTKVSCCLDAEVSQTLHMECTGSTSFGEVKNPTWWGDKIKKRNFSLFFWLKKEEEGSDAQNGSLTSMFSSSYSFSDWLRGSALQRLLACCILHCQTETE